jgi:patatin-related protein
MLGNQGRRKGREVRLGLVMYGGVSLAIYINGIANELFRAVRGRGTYRLLKAITDSDVIVDVLSGSSAGGINGVLLAYSLCNEREFAGSSKLWREHGDIGGLMRGIDEPLDRYQSLLDSEGKYEPWLKDAFDKLDQARIDENEREDKSSFDELDLFVTGTDYYGRKSVTFDDRAVGIDVKDHRTVFWLKHRAGRKEPFSPAAGGRDEPNAATETPTTHAALARLSRITSCFPGAFAPVTVDGEAPVSLRLRRWGAVPGAGQRVYIDGGVLDNKPFSTTLDAIYSRLADRPVSRWLLYVEPDPESFKTDPAELKSPAVVQTGVSSLTALPGYESIADDLRRLRAHNEQAERITALRNALVNLADSLPRASSEHGPDVEPQSAAEHAKKARDVVERREYVRLRLIGLGDQVFRSLFTREIDGGGAGRRDPKCNVFEAQRVLRAWFMGAVVPTGEQDWHTYSALDVAFRLRRLFHLTYRYQADLNETGLAAAVNRQIETLEIMRSALEAGVERVAFERFGEAGEKLSGSLDEAWAKELWTRVFDTVNALANVSGPERYRRPMQGGPLTPAEDEAEKNELKAFAQRLSQARNARGASASAHAPVAGATFFEESDAFERRLLAGTPKLADAHANYERVDGLLYPIEAVAGLRSYDVVSLARVSPRDAQSGLSCKDMSKKVTGTRYGHFAAFFKRSWRSNDILWGRLDGACELVDLLLKPERLKDLFDTPTPDARLLAELTATMADIEADATALPLPPSQRTKLFDWLRRLISADLDDRKRALDELEAGKKPGRDQDGPKSWLILGAQLEALRPGLGDVFADHHSERYEQEHPGGGSLGAAEVQKRAEDRMAAVGATPGKLIGFFQNQYAVGSEDLGKIPAFVVADWITRALILTRNALLVSAGKRAEGIRSHLLFQMFFGWPLRALAALSGLLRRAPHWIAAFTLGAVGYILLSIVVLALFLPDLEGSAHKLIARGLFIGLPLLLGLFLWLIARVRGPGGWFSKLIRVAAGLVGVAFLISLVPVFASMLHIQPQYSCAVLPFQLATACEKMWTCETATLAPWIVIGAALLGLLSVFGFFGWIGRKLPRKVVG